MDTRACRRDDWLPLTGGGQRLRPAAIACRRPPSPASFMGGALPSGPPWLAFSAARPGRTSSWLLGRLGAECYWSLIWQPCSAGGCEAAGCRSGRQPPGAAERACRAAAETAAVAARAACGRTAAAAFQTLGLAFSVVGNAPNGAAAPSGTLTSAAGRADGLGAASLGSAGGAAGAAAAVRAAGLDAAGAAAGGGGARRRRRSGAAAAAVGRGARRPPFWCPFHVTRLQHAGQRAADLGPAGHWARARSAGWGSWPTAGSNGSHTAIGLGALGGLEALTVWSLERVVQAKGKVCVKFQRGSVRPKDDALVEGHVDALQGGAADERDGMQEVAVPLAAHVPQRPQKPVASQRENQRLGGKGWTATSQGNLFLRGILRLEPCSVRCAGELPQNPAPCVAPRTETAEPTDVQSTAPFHCVSNTSARGLSVSSVPGGEPGRRVCQAAGLPA